MNTEVQLVLNTHLDKCQLSPFLPNTICKSVSAVCLLDAN